MKIQDAIDEFDLFKEFSESVKRYSEWLLGISIAISASLLTFQNFYIYLHIPVLILSFILIGFVGYIKYLIHLREMTMNIHSSQLRKNQIFYDLEEEKETEKYEKKFSETMKKYREKDHEILEIASLTNKASLCTLIIIILAAITIVINLMYCKF